MVTILGYTVSDICDIASLWAHEKNEVQHKDLSELLEWYMTIPRKTPNDCLHLGFKISQCRGVYNVSRTVEMVKKFIEEAKS